MRLAKIAGLGLLLSAAAGSAVAAPEVRLCPTVVIWAHPEEEARKVYSLLLQSIIIANPNGPTFRAASVDIALMDGQSVRDTRVIDAAGLTANAAAGPDLQALGKVLPGQFCGGQPFGGLTLASTADVAAGEGLLIFQQSFGWNGRRDSVRITVRGTADGKPVEVSAHIPIRLPSPSTKMIFPLAGRWYVGSAGSAFSHHRWGTFEEFALDIVQLTDGGLTYRGSGARFTDYAAYGKPVLAVADGVVVAVTDGVAEDPGVMRRAGESQGDYRKRIVAHQDELLNHGASALVGNHVVIDHGNGEFSMYAHLRPGSVKVSKGQAVKTGTPIGAIGSSGSSTEPHLHFQLCDTPDPVSCASIPLRFSNVDIPWEFAPRALQSGDIVVTRQP